MEYKLEKNAAKVWRSPNFVAVVEVESRKIYGWPKTRCKRKASATFDVTMPDVHLYGLHCNLHCALAHENARDIALHAPLCETVQAHVRVEFGTCANVQAGTKRRSAGEGCRVVQSLSFEYTALNLNE